MPKRKSSTNGRPRKKGQRLPTLAQVAENVKTKWEQVRIPDRYGEGRRRVEIVSGTAVWFHTGQPPLPIHWVLIRDPKGRFKAQALLSTDLRISPVQMIKWFVLRWQLEVTRREVREYLGVKTQRQWSDKAILRTTPTWLALFSLVKLIAHRHAEGRKLPVLQAAWYHKIKLTFSDALAR